MPVCERHMILQEGKGGCKFSFDIDQSRPAGLKHDHKPCWCLHSCAAPFAGRRSLVLRCDGRHTKHSRPRLGGHWEDGDNRGPASSPRTPCRLVVPPARASPPAAPPAVVCAACVPAGPAADLLWVRAKRACGAMSSALTILSRTRR